MEMSTHTTSGTNDIDYRVTKQREDMNINNNQSVELIVNGYINNMYKYNYYYIPIDIILICMNYYKQITVSENWNLFDLICNKNDDRDTDKELLCSTLLNNFIDLEMLSPTNVQKDIIDIFIKNNYTETFGACRDINILSHNGSGKTMALCIISLLKINKNINGSQILYLCPTKSLFIYVVNIFKLLIKSDMKTVLW